MTFWMYNLTNPEEVRNGSAPDLELVGPFNYLESREKHNPEFSADKTTVSFTYTRIFTRVEEPCPPGSIYPDVTCSLDDNMNITTGNIALMAVANQEGAVMFDIAYGLCKNKDPNSKFYFFVCGWNLERRSLLTFAPSRVSRHFRYPPGQRADLGLQRLVLGAAEAAGADPDPEEQHARDLDLQVGAVHRQGILRVWGKW